MGLAYSDLRRVAGLEKAALMDWKLMVNRVRRSTAPAAARKRKGLRGIR